MADLSVDLLGYKLKTPFVLGSGPLSFSGEAMVRAMEHGFGAVVTKTIRLQPAVNPVPHIWQVNATTLINAEKWADDPPEQWVTEYIPQARERGAIVIASIGHTVEEAEALVEPVTRAGAHILELVSYQHEAMVAMVRLARRKTRLPILAKISPNSADPVGMAIACLDAGADGITAIDSLGPTLRIDINTGRPVLGSVRGQGWTSGAAIKPLAVRIVADIAHQRRGPIVGTGGVMKGEDAVEMLMAGATAVGVCSAPIALGMKHVPKMLKQLNESLDRLGFTSAAAVSGHALRFINETEDHGLLEFAFKDATCTNCQKCVDMCPYEARHLTRPQMDLDRDLCVDCGFCVAVCPTDALLARHGEAQYGKQIVARTR